MPAVPRRSLNAEMNEKEIIRIPKSVLSANAPGLRRSSQRATRSSMSYRESSPESELAEQRSASRKRLTLRLRKMPATNTNNQIEESPTKNDEQAAEAPPVVDPVCPICHNIISGSLEDVNDHIDECLGDASSEVEPGQRRTVFETPGSDFDELPTAAINIEGDESRYGKPQYANADVTRILQEVKKNPFKDILDTIPDSTMEDPKEVMLKRLRLQKERLDSAARCILCLDSFINPVVSTVCWHVYCEACWCLTLDCKRLCPQCNKITSAEDLRRIYF